MTSEGREPIDDLVRDLFTADDPDPDDVEQAKHRARAALDRAIAEETRRRPRRRGFGWVAAAAVFIVVVVGGVVVFDLGGSSPASAAIEEIAAAVEAVPASTITGNEFYYFTVDSTSLAVVDSDMFGDVAFPGEYLVYLTSRYEERWRSASGVLQIRQTAAEPTFFDPEAADAYWDAGLDEVDRVGETTTETFEDSPAEEWPTDQAELDAAIRAVMVTDRGLPETVEYLDVALDILRDPVYTSDLRAATLRLISDLDGLELEDSSGDEATLSIDYLDRGLDTRLTFTVGNDGHLRYEQTLLLETDPEFGIPADTAVHTATYSTPVVVDSPTETDS